MTFRPLQRWPQPEAQERRRAPFSAGWSSTIGTLMTELRHLGPRPKGPAWSELSYPKSVLQLAMREQDFRRTDGLPRAGAVPTHPGVVLNIESIHGPLSYPCDAFDRWQDNLRAITLGLEALRKVSRYGITPGNEQYTGWKALPSATMTVEEAEAYIEGVGGDPDGNGLDIGSLQQCYRRAKAKAHPDRNDGDQTLWNKVEAAAEVLRAAGAL
jgi:hypothetical protein